MPVKANAEIEAIADELAALRGQSVEEVVAAALGAELARERRTGRLGLQAKLGSPQRAEVARTMDMVRAAGPAERQVGDRSAFLYDDQGLPR